MSLSKFLSYIWKKGLFHYSIDLLCTSFPSQSSNSLRTLSSPRTKFSLNSCLFFVNDPHIRKLKFSEYELSDTEKVSRAYLRILNWYVDGCYQSLLSITKQLLKQMKLWEILASSWQTCILQYIPFPVCFLNSSHTKKQPTKKKKTQQQKTNTTHTTKPNYNLQL